MLKIGSVVMNCKDFDRTVAFWQQALGYVAREPADDGWVVLRDPAGSGPNVSVQGTAEPKYGRNRTHLDLYATDQKAEVERLLKIGATIHQPAQAGRDFVTLADPEGKLFDVVQLPTSTPKTT
jgi:catechol 2,3-dioxygenase-like lactoylglutathione lyase family enzyme